MTEALMEELKDWKFLDSWDGFLPWKCEKHFTLKIISDASNFGWGGIFCVPSAPMQIRDYWTQEDLEGKAMAVKEAKALFKILSTFSEVLFNTRVDRHVDNSNLLHFWNNEGEEISL